MTNLRKLREAAGLSQQQVADHLGISAAAYQLYEYGKRAPKNSRLLKLCELFRVSADQLFADPEQWHSIVSTEDALLSLFRLLAPGDRETAIEVLKALGGLNPDGQAKVLGYTGDLAGNPGYQAPLRAE